MLTKIKIKENEDVFSENFVELDVKRGHKILSDEPYVDEFYQTLLDSWGDGHSISTRSNNDIVSGTISKIDKGSIEVDVGAKFPAYINPTKESSEVIEALSLGDEVKIRLKVKDEDSAYDASLGDVIKENKIAEIVESIDQPVAYRAKVNDLIHGGYVLDIDGVNAFMPGSLAGMNVLWDFESLIGDEIIVMPISFSDEKRTIVVSRRKYYETILPEKVENIRSNIDQEYVGNVTGTQKFGVFVEFDECVTGLIPASDLDSEWKKKHENGDIKPGDEIGFFVNQIIHDKKIMLTQVRNTTWDNLEDEFKPLSKVTGKIVKVRNYGVFIELKDGVVGMLHSSEYSEGEYFEEGEDIEVKIDSINTVNKRIVLKR